MHRESDNCALVNEIKHLRPCRAEFMHGNMTIYLPFILNIVMAQVAYIPL